MESIIAELPELPDRAGEHSETKQNSKPISARETFTFTCKRYIENTLLYAERIKIPIIVS
jgi:hypothetical protein